VNARRALRQAQAAVADAPKKASASDAGGGMVDIDLKSGRLAV